MKTLNHLALAAIKVNLSEHQTTPLYRQLLEQLRKLIVSGQITANELLPASRSMARELGVSRTTILNAYDQLLTEGYLISRPGAGIYVAPTIASREAVSPAPAIKQQPSAPAHYQGFSSGPDTQAFPFPLWARCLAKSWRHPNDDLLSEYHPGGYWPLRQQICQYLKRMRGLECQPRQVIVTAGHRDALSLISKLLCQPKDRVMLENPGYPLASRVIKSLGLKTAYCQVDKSGAQPPAQQPNKQAAKVCILTTTRHFPLGVAMTGARRQAWLNYAQQTDSWLVEDDYDSEFIYSGTPSPPLFNLNHNQHTLFLGTFSKLMFQHFRLGYLVVPEALAELAEATQMQLGAMASVHIQPALASFLADRHFSSHMRKMRKLYQHKRNLLTHCINQELSPWLAAKTPTGGMHLLALANTDLNDLEVEQQAKSYGISCPALSKYFQHTSKPPQGFLLGFSGTTIEQMHSNTGILKQILQAS